MAENQKSSSGTLTEEEKAKFRELFSKAPPYDPRFPNTNQTKNCQINYLDYYRCLKVKDESYCEWYKNAYEHLCPRDWIEKWDEQREAGTFPVRDIL